MGSPLKEITDSRFHAWRSIVAIAHADGMIHSEESEFINGYIERMPFSDEQKKTLHADLAQAPNVDDLIPKITHPSDRAQVVHFARLLCYRDGEFHPNEKQILDKLHSHAMQEGDLKNAMNAAGAAGQESQEKIDSRPKFLLERIFEKLKV